VQLGRPLTLIAESSDNDPRLVRARDGGGYGLGGVWSDDWHHALHAVLTGERSGYYADYGTLGQLGKALRQAWVYDGGFSRFRGRRHGGSPAGIPGDRFVVCTQNHDQVGNRAAGDRLSELVDTARLKVAAGLLLTAPFTPLLFQGEEWAAAAPFCYFTDFADRELGRAVSEGRRQEFASFGWDPADVPDPQERGTFERSVLDWSELEKDPHAEVLAWYRELAALRRRVPALRDPRPGTSGVDVDEEAGALTVQRGNVRVFVNLGRQDRTFPDVPGAELLAASDAGVVRQAGGVRLPPDTLAVVGGADGG
jgi:maltooligosyltrehalose trehalohydrolase